MATEQQFVIVPNAINPYGYELVNNLAYPSGFIQRFRFEDEWVDPVLAKGTTSHYVGSPGYIVLRDKDTGQLYPIRKFKLLSLSRVGKIHHFRCELGELFEFDTDEAKRAEQLKKFNEDFIGSRAELSKTNLPKANMTPLVFTTRYLPALENLNSIALTIEDTEAERWGNILACLRNVTFYDQVEFFRIVSVAILGSPKAIAPIEDHAYVLRRGKCYEIIVAQYRLGGLKEGDTPRDIKLIGDGAGVIPVRAKERAVGKYDILTFVLRLDRDAGSSKTFFDLEITPRAESAAYVNPLIHVPITLRRSLTSLLVHLGIAIVFGAIYFVPSIVGVLAEVLPPTVWGLESHQFVHDCALVALAVTMVDLLAELRKQ